MFKINEYFNGNVKSISLKDAESTASIGVMAVGNYEFGTSTKEIMKVISGSMIVKLPDSNDWQTFGPGQTFQISANMRFFLKIQQVSTYFCQYITE